ncbi:Dimer-Tnp-hAT domain-containing protein [Mycena chlorophos]|uniref:Dimer-Tnp-hAT domain-containing protein n=1 Tax=Mycena chlorophos TaxID=658473 RepID=A0A8H6SG57_MYCCL|nr:Dimer-Tnp-hAT domain-containing protein [Mycena chlorophos]
MRCMACPTPPSPTIHRRRPHMAPIMGLRCRLPIIYPPPSMPAHGFVNHNPPPPPSSSQPRQKHWPALDAKQAETWILEAMTAFVTAQRLRTARAAVAAAPAAPAPRPTAAAKQASGLAGLASTLGLKRRIVVPLRAPAANPSSLPTPSSSGSSTPAVTPSPVEPTVAEKAAAEKRALEDDARVARLEWEMYKNEPLWQTKGTGLELVHFWDLNSQLKPYLFRVACDVLPVQATAVPCERVFSSSAETDTKRRNRLGPHVFEALELLKFYYRNEGLDYTGGLVAREEDYTIDGSLTPYAIRELLLTSKVDELKELARNALEREQQELESEEVELDDF